MGYREALEKAGAEVLLFEEFGSYQGDWWAKVIFHGEVSWVKGSYGSCSGCDAFEGEFGYCDNNRCETHQYDEKNSVGCPDCDKKATEYNQRLADFGKSYLDSLYTQDEAEKQASKNLEWDMEAEKMLAFIKENKTGQ